MQIYRKNLRKTSISMVIFVCHGIFIDRLDVIQTNPVINIIKFKRNG